MNQQTVSILLPTYEPQETFLRAAIGAVIHQSHPHWTLHIRDDASETAVEEMVRPYLRDNRISFVRNAKRLGIGGNWNACLRGTDGAFVAFLFQDDLWYRTYLEESLAVFEQEASVGLVTARHAYAADDNAASRAFLENGPFRLLEQFWEKDLIPGTHPGRRFLHWWLTQGLQPNVVGEPSFVVLRRSLTDRLGPFREDMHQGLDREYWTRALLATDVHFLDKDLGIFRVHQDAASMRHDRLGQGLADRLRCFELLLSRTIPRNIRDAAAAAIVNQIRTMAQKFRHRVGSGKKVNSSEKWRVLALFARHPKLLMQSVGPLVRGLRNQA